MNLDDIVNELEEEQNKKINRTRVKDAAMEAAEDIHGDVNKKIVNSIVDNAIKKAKDTEDAIQIAINMLRAE